MLQINNINIWLEERKNFAQLKIEQIPLSEVTEWIIRQDAIEHQTKGFFSIIGIASIDKQTRNIVANQPIINQPEIGILGFIFAKTKKRTKILLQAKTEPGNIHGTQIGPTVQATYSNYMRVHKGKPTKYLDYFITNGTLNEKGTLQSEQGTSFLGKYNRNISVFLNSEKLSCPPLGNWQWFSINELFNLLEQDYLINTDARSVLVCSDWNKISNNSSAFSKNIGKQNFGEDLYESYQTIISSIQPDLREIIKSLEHKRSSKKFYIKKRNFRQLIGWKSDYNLITKDNAFSVTGFSVSVKGREISTWSQPLLQSHEVGEVILYCKKISGILHFLVAFSYEIGFNEHVQFGPSVQIIDDHIFSKELNINPKKLKTIAHFTQSDEGGRFYHSIVRYYLKEIAPEEEVVLDDSHVWLTLGQIYKLVQIKGMFTNEFRSVLSLILDRKSTRLNSSH